MQAFAERIIDWILSSLLVQGVLLTTTLAMLRVVYDSKETKVVRIGLEGAIAGGITLGAGAGIRALGFNENWTLFIGGVIGTLGVLQVRELIRYGAKRALEYKLGDKSDE